MVMRTSGQRRVASILAPGAVGTDLTLSSDLIAAIVRGTTALEYPEDAANPKVRCTTDTDTGIGRTGPNLLSMFAGGGVYAFVQVSQLSMNGGAELYAGTGPFRAGGVLQNDPRVVDIAAVGTQIPAAGSGLVRVTLSAGAIISTAAPFIPDGSEGQEIEIVRHTDAGLLTISDQGTLANSNLRLSANTLGLGPRDSIRLRWIAAIGDWVQVGQVNVL